MTRARKRLSAAPVPQSEDPDAVRSLADYLKSFSVTGRDNPFVQAQGQLRLMALTDQFVVREYDPVGVLLN